jgi:DNA-binding NarL/FixJ family response regulator
MTTAIRIFLADDHPIVRDGLRAILSTQLDFDVIGEASNGAEAVQQILRLRPDVALLDLGMPVVDGVEALKQLREANAATRVIVFTAFDTDERIVAAVRAGAQGYLLKGAPREEIFQAIRVVGAGGSLLQPIVASKLMQHLHTQPDELTPRELEVLQCLARGDSNKEIAAALFITERTVKFHVSAIIAKLDASNRTEAVTMAAQRGLIHLSSQ